MNPNSNSEKEAPLPADLLANRSDRLAALSRSVSGAVPLVGGAIGEILTAVIPNQRADRIVAFLVALGERLDDLEQSFVEERLRAQEGVDLLEDGMYQAARTLSEERLSRLAALIKNGLTREDLEYLHRKKLVDLFGQLNDAEILILQSHLRENRQDDDFWDKHRDSVTGPMATMGSSSEEVDRAAVHEAYRRHLNELGLLRPRFKRPKRGELPEFDEKTGMMKSTGYQLTRLGGLLLRYLDLTDAEF